MLGNLGNRGSIALPVIGGVVAVVAVLLGVKIFSSINSTLTSAQLSSTGGLLDLTPLLLSALVIIAILAAFMLVVK